MKDYLQLSASDLLEEFGGGGHAPGSGSAAALIGLLAANLVYTVGQLTVKRSKYKQYHDEVDASCAKIQTVLIPTLRELLQRDAEAFDAVYQARVARDEAVDPKEGARLQAVSLNEQKLAIAIPFKIAEACLELIEISARVFDVGFQAARGDTGVALSAAVAGVLSAVFVINLNLAPFKRNYWARQRRHECDQLHALAMEKYTGTLERVDALRSEDVDVVEEDELAVAITGLLSGAKATYSDVDIDERAGELRALVWRKRNELWPTDQVPTDPVELLNPEVALRLLGYGFSLEESLGTFPSTAGTLEVAGLLEAVKGKVSVSRQMKSDVRLFTSAHELGHILLHPQLKEAHRDRPLNGTVVSRNLIEREADRFASSYLMPSRLVTDRFLKTFKTDRFALSEATTFALWGSGAEASRRKVKNRRELAFTLATAVRYNGRQVVSLAHQFKVSPTTMAIRLEELGLIWFDQH
ncbi:cyclodeaminase/cyclohydrolase family protein [Massilia sp. R2A-15]|uniref:cyclodeaminase/cyclohydrolase family protein n=1 Tax=Massilia sp. R2A-15 TaxID=3064278 RepID=UPI0027327DC0|nr:cyclodeaminase/cyclohydrolase family protein [Massilia sp. R2A-15]WLI90080.1 cyclodeaminase/cyclohydrolase family protein [Massilia sp. R2A-15]